MDLVVEGLMDALKNKSKLSEEEIVTSLNNRAEKLNQLHEERSRKSRKRIEAKVLPTLRKTKRRRALRSWLPEFSMKS